MIDKSTILKKITQSKDVKDYTYAILFLLISSFFAFAVIKPVVTIAVSLDKEAKDLRVVNAVFEKNITHMVDLQNKMQEIRPQLFLVDTAIPEDPQIQILIKDIRSIALQEGIIITNIDVVELEKKETSSLKKDIKQTTPEYHKPITMTISLATDFNSAVSLTKQLLNQRRLKIIRKINIDKKIEKTGDNYLNINLEIEGYYL